MATRETDPERKEALETQAKAFRKSADKRAENLASLLWNRHRYSEDLVCFYARPGKICGLTPAD